MLKKIFSILLVATIILGLNPGIVNAKDDSTKEVFNESYISKQLDNETLLDKADNGEFINNEFTQVQSYYEDDGATKIVEINKLLSKEVFSDGTEVETYSLDSLVSQATVIIGTGTKEETYNSGSVTFSLTNGFLYEKMSQDGGVTYSYKITNYYSKPVLKDSTYVFTQLDTTTIQDGTGYYSDGAPTLQHSSSSFTVSYPNSNSKYSANTNFGWYVNVNDGSGGGTTSTLTYRRVNGTTPVVFTYNLHIGS